ncbi:MAG: HRDC domain-containing protein [Acidimicrobiia bacterium]|nr:HRDC domain-containing protein [Acidimicrobiia bacterium]
MTHTWVDQEADLDALIDQLLAEPRYAIDTEFHRERTYFPRLALVQIAWSGGIAIIDPLAVDAAPLRRLFAGDGLAVAHAAQQDLDVLTHAVGAIPGRLFDTQLAAGFVGYGTPSLTSLLQGELKVTPAKGDRLTDWLRRPLSDAQREYAASDVRFLLDLHDRLAAELAGLGRLGWTEAACEELRRKPTGATPPESAWLKLKDARALRSRSRAVAQAIAAWREREAAASDTPVRQILSDLAVLGIAQRQPTTLDELAQSRGVDERHLRGRIGRNLLAAVVAAKEAEPPQVPDATEELDRAKRPAVTLVSAWVSQVARDSRIDTALLATRADLLAILRGDPAARLSTGWRAELLGDAISRLTEGHAALTFDGKGSLRLVDVATGVADSGPMVPLAEERAR